jgi:hypothetical protein
MNFEFGTNCVPNLTWSHYIQCLKGIRTLINLPHKQAHNHSASDTETSTGFELTVEELQSSSLIFYDG